MLLLLLLLLLLFTFTEAIYNYIPDTNHVSIYIYIYNVTAVLWLQFVVTVMLFPKINVVYFHINTFRSMGAMPIVDKSDGVFSISLKTGLSIMLGLIFLRFTSM